MKKLIQKTLLSLSLIAALCVSGIAYQPDTAKAADDYTSVLTVTDGTATAATPVSHSFSLEAKESAAFVYYVPQTIGVNVKVTQVSTGEVIYERSILSTDTTWSYSDTLAAYYNGFTWNNPTAGNYTLTLTFDADTPYLISGIQNKTTTTPVVKNPYLNYSNVTITKGFTQKLAVQDNSGSVTWNSSNKKVATVDKNGKVTAKKAGTATITAKTASGKLLSCKVTVKNNVYTAKKLAVKSITYGNAAMNIYKVSYSKGNLVIKARFLNNSIHKVKYLKNVKIKIKNGSGKVIGTYSAKKIKNANVKAGKAKAYTFKIKKSKLKIKKTQDLRKLKTSVSGKFVYNL